MPAPIKWDDIRGLLPPERRREIEARAGRKPARERKLARRQEPGEAGAAAAVEVTGPGEGWNWRVCEQCRAEFLAAPEIRCPIECWRWWTAAHDEERDERPGKG